jgi:hypothetical protein
MYKFYGKAKELNCWLLNSLKEGLAVSIKIKRKIYSKVKPSMVYMYQLNNPPQIIPNPNVTIVLVTKDNYKMYKSHISQICSINLKRKFKRNSSRCLLSYYKGIPCAIGIEYPQSYLTNALHLKNVLYLGDFFVIEKFRGHSIYGTMLYHIIETATNYESLFLEIEPHNIPSIKAVTKIGFKYIGKLKGRIILGYPLFYIDATNE